MKLKRNLCLLTMLFTMVMIFILPSKAQAATVGDVLTSPEVGWQRYDNTNKCIIYSGTWAAKNNNGDYMNTGYTTEDTISNYKFKFYGTKLRLIVGTYIYSSDKVEVKIDGMTNTYSEYTTDLKRSAIGFESKTLDLGYHTVEVKNLVAEKWIYFDAIDIYDGYLVNQNLDCPTNLIASYDATGSAIKLQWKPVTGAKYYNIKRSTTSGGPYNISVASGIVACDCIDSNIKEDTTYYYVVTAEDNNGESPYSNEASCTPKAPSIITGNRAILVITFNNGKEKEYDLSADEINKFNDWYDKRSDGSGKAYFALPKYGYVKPFNARKEFIKFDNIESFEIKDYYDK